MEFIIAVLSARDATINLALPDSRSLLPCLEHLPIQRLSVDVHALFHPAPPSFMHPLFAPEDFRENCHGNSDEREQT